MLTKEIFVDIITLYRQGKSMRAIARDLNISRNTVKKYIVEQDTYPQYKSRLTTQSKLTPYKQYILQRIESAKPHWIPACVLFQEIKDQGYPGGITLVRDYVAQFKTHNNEPVIRFETKPGQQLQIDFTTIRRGKSTLKAFVATLGYSRATFVRFYDHERTDAWIDGLIESFHYFGGVPEDVLCDNAKALVIERDAYGEGKHRWNTRMLDLSLSYGFKLKACRPYRAKTKGKVERFNHYLKNSFVVPLAASLNQVGLKLDCDTENGKIGPWLENVAHQRKHGTTNEKPQDRLDYERRYLSVIPKRLQVESSEESSISIIPLVIPHESECIQHPISTYERFIGDSYASV